MFCEYLIIICRFWTMVHQKLLQRFIHTLLGEAASAVEFKYFITAIYHFEVSLLQFASSIFQPLSENSQLSVLPPQSPDLLLSLRSAALSLKTSNTNVTIRLKLQKMNEHRNTKIRTITIKRLFGRHGGEIQPTVQTLNI